MILEVAMIWQYDNRILKFKVTDQIWLINIGKLNKISFL